MTSFVELGADADARVARRSGPRVAAPVPAPSRAPLAFHRALPGYRATPLTSLPELARTLGLESLYVKDEGERLGLPSFKILGASWAVYRALSERLGSTPEPGADMARAFALLRPLTLVAATDGNHGRALAHVGRLLGFDARILVPAGTAAARIEAIASEGATVEIVDGSYDLAVEIAAQRADERTVVIADTAWDGYEQVPTWISEGYSTIFWEVDDALARQGLAEPDLVLVQIGVGALARAAVAHYRRDDLREQPALVGVEPLDAACALETALAGEIVHVPGPHRSVMAGLNAGLVSTVALAALLDGIDAYVAIPDSRAREAVRAYAEHGLVAGETGAAGLAGLMAAPEVMDARHALVIVTEGATDPVSYARAIAR